MYNEWRPGFCTPASAYCYSNLSACGVLMCWMICVSTLRRVKVERITHRSSATRCCDMSLCDACESQHWLRCSRLLCSKWVSDVAGWFLFIFSGTVEFMIMTICPPLSFVTGWIICTGQSLNSSLWKNSQSQNGCLLYDLHFPHQWGYRVF